MPVVMNMHWPEVSPEQYDRVRDVVKWETDHAKGGIFHAAYFTGDGFHVTDIWETAEDFQDFVDRRLMPGVQQVGVAGQPKVEITPTHRIFSPYLQPAAAR
jgi:hypothetical protein